MNDQTRCRALISLDNIAHNVAGIKKFMRAGCLFMGVVKADAYGHGDLPVAKELERIGADMLGVSCFDEAVYLRKNEITAPILILGPTPAENAADLIRYGLKQTVHSSGYAKALSEACVGLDEKIPVHIKVDTGMSRIGFHFSGEEDIRKAASYESFDAEGIFTHFACADEAGESAEVYTRLQFNRFCSLLRSLGASGLTFRLKHCCNSGGAIRYPEMHMDMVRIGIALYGLNPSADCAGLIHLRPAMELYSNIAEVKEIEAGTPVSYGRTFTAEKKITVATVSTGYADGYPRALSNAGRMLVRGQCAPVIGRVCMDYLMLDVTHIGGVSAGDLVTVVGKDGENAVTLDEIAECTGTINYERACLVGKRVPRVYTREGREVFLRDYLNRE